MVDGLLQRAPQRLREAVSTGGRAFTLPIRARFGACDPVGIVYFPRYFDWFHQAMEAWFDTALGTPYHVLLRHHGLPAVHTEADYRAPVRFGDDVRVELRVGHLGRSSMRLDYRVLGSADQVHATGHTMVVHMGTDPQAADHMQAVPFPADLRAALAPFQAPDAS